MERLTKLAITLWAGAAIALQVWILHYSWRELPLLTLVAVLSMALVASFERRSVAIVMVLAYVFPVLVRYMRGFHSSFYSVLWLAALLGVMLPDIVRTPWHLRRRWRMPLVFSVFVVAVSAVIVLVREMDGVPLLLLDTEAAYATRGFLPTFTARWVLSVALTLVIGVLWFDWLCGAEAIDVERTVITPLVGGALLMSLVAVYQVFIDGGFWNDTVYRVLGRATGTTYDANVAGMIAALWLGGTWLWAIRLRGWRVYLLPIAMIVHGIAVWGSGSRTALVAATGVAAGIGVSLTFNRERFSRGRAGVAAAVVALIVAGGVGFGAANQQQPNNPVARFWDLVVKHPSPAALATEMWNRNGYGAAATQMIRQSPVAGVGVGAFHGLVTELSLNNGRGLPPDNAQNWLRHQVAEFGFLGGAGWLAWFALFAALVCLPRRGEPSSIWIARGVLVAFGFISLFGMPGQDPMVAVTFWVLACWYTRIAGPPVPARPLGLTAWTSMTVAIVVFAAASTLTARTWLRVPERARREHQPFSYGYGPIFGAGPDTGYRVVNMRAAVLINPQARWLLVSVRLADSGTTSGPVDVRVWRNGDVVLKAQLTRATPFSGVVPVGDTPVAILLETSAGPAGRSRWWSPAAVSAAMSTAASGVLMKWEFVDDVPSRFQGYRRPTEGG